MPTPARLMPIEELRQTSWIGDAFVNGPITAVVINFQGLGFGNQKGGPGYDESEWADAGALCIVPFAGPWSWMNRQARAFVDQLLASVYHHFEIPKHIPLITTGGSMGGHGSLLYTRYAAKPVTACAAIFPVCDIEYHFSERPDLPSTLRNAWGYPADLAPHFAENSPLKQAAAMPDIPYFIAHGDKDQSVKKEAHSDPFVAELRRLGRTITYLEVPGMGHGTNTPYRVPRTHINFIKSHFHKPT